MGSVLVWRGGGVHWRGSDGRRVGVEGWGRSLGGQPLGASSSGGVAASTGAAAMGSVLVWRGGGAYWRGSDGRRVDVEWWGRLLPGQPSAASWCGGVAVSTGGAAMGGALVSRVGAFTGGAAIGVVLVWRGGGEHWRGSDGQRLGVEG